MFERFTDRARKVLALANQEAQRLNHEYIGTGHILLGLVKEGSGVGATEIKNHDVDIKKLRLEVEKLVESGPDMVKMGKLPLTSQAKKVIDYAIEEARSLNHNYVGTEHILLGLLRESEGIAAQVLINLGLKREDLRQEVLNLPIETQKRDLKTLLTKGLTRAERLIIVLYYNDDMTFKEIASTLQLSEARIAQMHSSIIARLKAQMNTRKKEFAIGAEKKKQGPRKQHYLFANETMRDLFFKEPEGVINKLTDDNWKEYLLEIWGKAGKNLEKFCFVAPDGLSREIRKRADNTVIAIITLPKPQVITEAYFIALLCRPCEKNLSSEQKVIPRFLLLEYSVPCGYGSLNTALHEWREEGVHKKIGYGCEPTLEAFYEAVCNILDEHTRNSSYNTGEITMSKKHRKSENIIFAEEGLLKNEVVKKFLKKYLKDPEIDYICSLRKKLDKKIPGLTEAFNKKSRYFIYWKGTDKDRTYMYVQKKKLRIDLLISRNFEEEILQEDEDFEVHHKNNFQGRDGWLTGWYVPYSTKNINVVVKYISKAFEGNP